MTTIAVQWKIDSHWQLHFDCDSDAEADQVLREVAQAFHDGLTYARIGTQAVIALADVASVFKVKP